MSSLLQPLFVRAAMQDAGWSPEVTAEYRRMVRDGHRVLDAANVPADARRVWIVPGRVEVLGKHVDYAGGRSLLCTVERGIVLIARARDDRTTAVRDVRRKETVHVRFDGPSVNTVPWSVYPRTVLGRLAKNFGDSVRGCDVAITSNLPSASGVSSSSALTVGLTLAVSALSSLDAHPAWQQTLTDRLALAGYVGAVENGLSFGALAGDRGVGTMGGAQDQTAILCSVPNALGQFAWAPVRCERTVVWPSEYVLVIGVSGVVASKAGGAKERYNRAARTAHRLVQAWNASVGGQATTLRAAIEAAAGTTLPTALPPSLLATARDAADAEFSAHHLEERLHQFFDETFMIVPGAAAALAEGDLGAFGGFVERSQAGAERALENQIAETVHLVRYARDLGAAAASAFGAGFGGSVWAMVKASDAEHFARKWRERYLRVHGKSTQRATFFITAPTMAAFELSDELR